MSNTIAPPPRRGKNCIFCHRPGARWQLKVNGEELPVHRRCGKIIAAMAPKGQAAMVTPTRELREEWQAQAFWSQKLQEAKAAKAASKAAAPGCRC